MEVEGQITLDEWMQWKEDIRRKLKETAGNFVYIGCRLRQIRDSGMLDGAADIFEFAQREYGLSKSTTSRFIAVNERFADPYNPLLIKEEFENIGSSKLSEMLTLPDSECELITEKTTVKEIRDLKAFNKEAEKLENVEESTISAVATSQQTTENEPDPEQPAVDYTPLQKCIIEYFREKQGLLNKALGQIREKQWKEAYETVNPGGYVSCNKGLCFLFMYDFNRGISYKLMTEPAPVNMNWEDFLMDVAEIYGEQSWEEFYGKPEKKEPEMEETEMEEPEKTKEPPKQQTIHSVEPSVPEPDPIPEEPEKAEMQGEAPEEPEQQLPGQMEVVNTDMEVQETKENTKQSELDILVKIDKLKQYVYVKDWSKLVNELETLLKTVKERVDAGRND